MAKKAAKAKAKESQANIIGRDNSIEIPDGEARPVVETESSAEEILNNDTKVESPSEDSVKEEGSKEEVSQQEVEDDALKNDSLAEGEPENKGKDKFFLYAILVIVIALIIVILLPRIIPMQNLSLLGPEELHKKNLEGKLPPNMGYIYKGGYSFVFFDSLWYTQLKTPVGTRIFNIPFHYSPRDVENISIKGSLNYSNLERYKGFFMTFDPVDTNLNYIAVSIGETDQVLLNAFGKNVIAACSKNETDACVDRPIIECNSTEAPVFYFKSGTEANVTYNNNCAVISGYKTELFRATDRMLFDFLGIIKR